MLDLSNRGSLTLVTKQNVTRHQVFGRYPPPGEPLVVVHGVDGRAFSSFMKGTPLCRPETVCGCHGDREATTAHDLDYVPFVCLLQNIFYAT